MSTFQQIVIPPEVLSAEPLADSIIAVTTQGAVDLSDISVALNGTVCFQALLNLPMLILLL
jgi:hypothetical protein